MAECLAGTAYAKAMWHALRRGSARACWAGKPNLAYFKWWGRWQSTVVAISYATRWTDPAVITPTVLPTWKRGEGPKLVPSRVGLMSVWGRARYPGLARTVDTPNKRKG